MVNRKRKHESGAATAFITRGKALKKLQLSLTDFRRLCILKGIYPQEPRSIKRAGKGSSAPLTYYLTKDIHFLQHEPIIKKMREHKIFVRKLKKAVNKKEDEKVKRIRKKKPRLSLDHIVKERYPTLVDALRDLDDALSLCFLIGTMPKSKAIQDQQIKLCRRLTVEFMNYVITSKSLRKVFISIKGFYIQIEVQGQLITWLMPHNVAYAHPSDVDYNILSTFSEFSSILLGFVNFSLYKSLELPYPPQLSLDKEDEEEEEVIREYCDKKDLITELLATMTTKLKPLEVDIEVDKFEDDLKLNEGRNKDEEKMKKEMEEVEKLKILFSGLKFFFNREINRQVFAFLIRCCSGEVSWEKSTQPLGATFSVEDPSITHHLVDRKTFNTDLFSRYYIQPQWIADSINMRKLLPVKDYHPSFPLPPHLSPFVEEQEGDYVPPEKIKLNQLNEPIERLNEQDEEEELDNDEDKDEDEDEKEKKDAEKEEKENKKIEKTKKKTKKAKPPENKSEKIVKEGKVQRFDTLQKRKEEENEQRKLKELAIPKKHKRLYHKIRHLNKKKRQEAENLAQKRKNYEANLKKNKK